MANPRRECGTCKWWSKGVGWEYGTCKDALARARKAVPSSVFIPFEPKDVEIETGGIHVTQMAAFGGVDCPCWENKEAV